MKQIKNIKQNSMQYCKNSPHIGFILSQHYKNVNTRLNKNAGFSFT